MWTPDSRKRYEDKGKQKKRYPTDLSDEEWAYRKPLLSSAAPTGRPRQVDFREVINAIRYLVRSGCGWRMLPHDFPPYETVYYWFCHFARRILFQTIHDAALMLDRQNSQRHSQPTAGMIDSQSVKAPAARRCGYDANKKVAGRKRHVTVDTEAGRAVTVWEGC